jgi:hypothetical protein
MELLCGVFLKCVASCPEYEDLYITGTVKRGLYLLIIAEVFR